MIDVLVTGANGQLGKSIQELNDQDANTNINIKFTFTSSQELDITDQNLVNSFFLKGDYDYCINCAAYTAVDKAETEEEKAYLVNAEAVKYLAEACKQNDTVLIHVSTDFVFDGQKGSPYTEDDPTNPIGVYGASKLKGEQYVQSILEKYFIVRTSWVYSEYGHNFVKTMLRLAEERNEISVVNDQIGSPTYAGGLAEFLCFLVQIPDNDYGIYNFSDEGEISWYDFALGVFKEFGKDMKVNPISSQQYPTLAKRPVYSKLSTDKIKHRKGVVLQDWKLSLRRIKNRNND